MLSSTLLQQWSCEVGFSLCGFARAEPIPKDFLQSWIEAGFHADMDWLSNRVDERLDVSLLLPRAQTVVAFATNYWREDGPSPIARYARGRDYHATLKDRLRAFRRKLREAHPEVRDYGAVDHGPILEKVWAIRAGLGSLGKNGCLITPQYGSWVLLNCLILDAPVDRYSSDAAADVCGRCQLCMDACPTQAIVEPSVVDARRCLSFQTIENEAPIPEAARAALNNIAFGCDICQEVCPFNASPVLADERFAPRAVAGLGLEQLAFLSEEDYRALVPGTPLARAGRDGLRRNALYALGVLGRKESAPALQQVAEADENAVVKEAAQWALNQLIGKW